MQRHELVGTSFRIPDTRRTLAFAGAALAGLLALCVAGVSFAVTAGEPRGCSPNARGQMACGNLIIRMTRADYEASLQTRERELRAEEAANRTQLKRLRQLHKEAAETWKGTVQAQIDTARADGNTLTAELNALKQRRLQPQDSYTALLNTLSSARAVLDSLAPLIPAASVDAANVALGNGDLADAERRLEAIAERLGELREPRDERAALTLFQAGKLAEERVDWRTAYQHFARAVELQPENWRYVQRAGNLAWSVGEYETAADYHESVLHTVLARFGAEKHKTATAMNALAIAYVALARYGEAESLLRKASAISEKTLGEEHHDVAVGYNNLAVLLEERGKHDEAERLFRRVIAIDEQVLGEAHPEVAQDYDRLAGLLMAKGKYDAAESFYRKALDIARSTLGPQHAHTRSIDRRFQRLLDERGAAK